MHGWPDPISHSNLAARDWKHDFSFPSSPSREVQEKEVEVGAEGHLTMVNTMGDGKEEAVEEEEAENEGGETDRR